MNRNRIQLAAICAFVFVVVFSTVAAAQGAKVNGQWKMTLQSPNGPEIRTLIFTSLGRKLTDGLQHREPRLAPRLALAAHEALRGQ